MVYAEGDVPENDISIECNDIMDMDNYSNACRRQGYRNVRTKAKPIMEAFQNSVDREYTMPMCPRCKEPTYSEPACPFCNQEIEWGADQ
jgi:hypothetical protein